MTLEILVEPDIEQVSIVLDNAIHLSAALRADGDVAYSSSFNKLVDDDIHDCLKEISEKLLRLVS